MKVLDLSTGIESNIPMVINYKYCIDIQEDTLTIESFKDINFTKVEMRVRDFKKMFNIKEDEEIEIRPIKMFHLLDPAKLPVYYEKL
jgi:hypothetical protein